VASSDRRLLIVVQESQCGEEAHNCVARTFSIRTLGPFSIQNIFPMQSRIFRVTCVLRPRCKVPTKVDFQQFRKVLTHRHRTAGQIFLTTSPLAEHCHHIRTGWSRYKSVELTVVKVQYGAPCVFKLLWATLETYYCAPYRFARS
jgi:hypothetical protein